MRSRLRRRRLRAPRRRRLVRRFRSVRRRISSGRRFSRRRGPPVFRNRALFPKSVVVTLPYRAILPVVPGATPDTHGHGGWFVANSLDNGGIDATHWPRGQWSMSTWMQNFVNGAFNSLIGLHGAVSTDIITTGYPNTANIPVSYRHLGNIYLRYRVLSWHVSLQVEQNSNLTADTFVLQLAASPDPDLVKAQDQGAFNTMHWHVAAKQQSFVSQRSVRVGGNNTATISSRAPIFSHRQRASALIRDGSYYKDPNWIGSCTEGAGGSQPTYVAPANQVFLYWGVQALHGGQVASGTTTAYTIVLTYTPVVKFFEPHENMDFLGPL